jgi:hypothetical protein
MANAVDYLTDDTGALMEHPITGDWMEGDSDAQHIKDILELEPGELFYDVLMGVGIVKSLNGPANANIEKTVQMQLAADGYRLTQLDIDNGIINVDAERNS